MQDAVFGKNPENECQKEDLETILILFCSHLLWLTYRSCFRCWCVHETDYTVNIKRIMLKWWFSVFLWVKSYHFDHHKHLRQFTYSYNKSNQNTNKSSEKRILSSLSIANPSANPRAWMNMALSSLGSYEIPGIPLFLPLYVLWNCPL